LIGVFLKVIRIPFRLQIACGRRFEGGLLEMQWLFREQNICHICTISVQISPNTILCTQLSSHSTKTQQRARIIYGLPLCGQSTLVSGRWSVALRPSVCPSVPCL